MSTKKRDGQDSDPQFFRLLLENGRDVVWTLEGPDRFGYVTPSVRGLLGYSREEFLDLSPGRVLGAAADMAPAHRRREVTLRRKDGGEARVEVGVAPLPEGGAQWTVRDVTRRWRTEQELKRKDRLLAGVAGAMQCLLAGDESVRAVAGALESLGRAAGVDRICLYELAAEGGAVGAALRHHWCASDASSLGGCLPDHIRELDLETGAPRLLRLLHSGLPVCDALEDLERPEREFLARRGAAASLLVPMLLREQCTGFLCLDRLEQGRPWLREEVSVLTAMAGILGTALRRLEVEAELSRLNARLEERVRERTAALERQTGELESANRLLQELDALKSSFLSTVSHELRTPMTSVLGFAKVVDRDFRLSFAPLAAGDSSMERRGARIARNLAIIRQEGERLTRMINDVLDLTRYMNGGLDAQDAWVDPAALAQEAAAAVEAKVLAKPGLRLKVSAQEGLPALWMDPARLRQVLVNLLDNAVKFTEAGSVRLDVRRHRDGLLLEVADTGRGMHVAGDVFEPFHQAAAGDTVEAKPVGTGLGLAICRAIVEHCGGEIGVDSAPGRGCTVRVRLPGALLRPGTPG